MASAVVIGGLAGPASATDGYFQVGFGARQSAMGGSGAADSRDAMAQTLNPAGIAGMGSEIQVGVGAFMPFRGYDATGTGFVLSGSVDSDRNFFVMPNFAYTRQLDTDTTLGVSVYGNGGMNTTYPATVNNSFACGGGVGVFCGGGKTGVDLMQAFVSVDLARRFGPVKIGIAPTMAVQLFKAYGLGAFAAQSIDPTHVTDNGYDVSYGFGVRGGVEWEAMPGLRFGLSGQTEMKMTKFDKYAGLFAEQGSFDIPGQVTAGVSYDATPDLTVNFDFQRIFYSQVASISNSSVLPTPLGANNGRGFGWHDVNVFKVGAEWRANDTWTFRGGYAYATNPIRSTDVMFNILAPGVVQHHFTAGGAYKLNERDTIEFAGMFVPESKVSGYEMGATGPNTASNITIHMHQFQGLVSWTRKF